MSVKVRVRVRLGVRVRVRLGVRVRVRVRVKITNLARVMLSPVSTASLVVAGPVRGEAQACEWQAACLESALRLSPGFEPCVAYPPPGTLSV